MNVPSGVSVVLSVAGVFIFIFAASQSGKTNRILEEPLRAAGLSRADRVKIKRLLRLRKLTGSQETQGLILLFAQWQTTIGITVFRWQLAGTFAAALIPSAFALLPLLFGFVLVAQSMILIFGISASVLTWREISATRHLTALLHGGQLDASRMPVSF